MIEYQFESAGPALRIIVLIFLFVFVIAMIAALVGIAALPGWVAKKRNHPQSAAINICGWFGLPTGILWVVAMVWAYVREPNINDQTSPTDAPLLAQVEQLEQTLTQLEAVSKGAST